MPAASTENTLRQIIQAVYLATWMLAMLSLILTTAGFLLLPMLGWPAFFLLLAGVASAVLAALPATILAVAIIAMRARHGYWFIGW